MVAISRQCPFWADKAVQISRAVSLIKGHNPNFDPQKSKIALLIRILDLLYAWLFFFLSIFTGSLIHEHYTRECEFGNCDKMKNKNNTKNKTTQKTQKTFGLIFV